MEPDQTTPKLNVPQAGQPPVFPGEGISGNRLDALGAVPVSQGLPEAATLDLNNPLTTVSSEASGQTEKDTLGSPGALDSPWGEGIPPTVKPAEDVWAVNKAAPGLPAPALLVGEGSTQVPPLTKEAPAAGDSRNGLVEKITDPGCAPRLALTVLSQLPAESNPPAALASSTTAFAESSPFGPPSPGAPLENKVPFQAVELSPVEPPTLPTSPVLPESHPSEKDELLQKLAGKITKEEAEALKDPELRQKLVELVTKTRPAGVFPEPPASPASGAASPANTSSEASTVETPPQQDSAITAFFKKITGRG